MRLSWLDKSSRPVSSGVLAIALRSRSTILSCKTPILHIFVCIGAFSISFLSYSVSEIRSFIFPVFFHSIIGTIWYFYLPMLFTALIGKKLKKFIDPKRFIFGLSSVVIGVFLFILCSGRTGFIQKIALHIILVSLSLIIIGLFFIIMSFFRK